VHAKLKAAIPELLKLLAPQGDPLLQGSLLVLINVIPFFTLSIIALHFAAPRFVDARLPQLHLAAQNNIRLAIALVLAGIALNILVCGVLALFLGVLLLIPKIHFLSGSLS